MKGLQLLLISFAIFAFASAYDPGPLQDICVGVNSTKYGVHVNGMFCKDPETVTVDDFVFTGIHKPGNTSNPNGGIVTPVFSTQLPGLNTMGISIARIDYAPNGGMNPPHTHPRATEILTVLKGKLLAGFITSNQDGNRLFSKILHKGDVIVFPIGTIQFQQNIGDTPAVALSSLSSQNPGVTTIGLDMFGSKPAIDLHVLTRAFRTDEETIRKIQSKF